MLLHRFVKFPLGKGKTVTGAIDFQLLLQISVITINNQRVAVKDTVPHRMTPEIFH